MVHTRGIGVAALAAFLLLAPASAEARTIALSWNPNPEPDVTGYTLFYGTQPGIYPNSAEVGNATTFQIDLPGVQYYFAVRAHTATTPGPLSTEVAESSAIALTYPADQTSATGGSVSLQLVAAGTPVSYTASNLPGGLSINSSTGLISGTISAGAVASSPYLVSASVSNAAGNTSNVIFTWIVTAGVNQPPVLTAPANQTSAENAAVSLQLVATDPNGNALTYSATGLPPSLTVNAATGLISGTLTFTSAGTYSVTATASDGSLSNSKTFSWTVTNVNRPPTITTPATQTSVENAIVSLQLVASDLDGNAVTFSAVGLPTGLTVNAVSGLISGTVAVGSAGTYNATATVSDGTLTATASFTWNVVVPGALTVDKVVFVDGGTTVTTPAFSTTTAGETLIAFVGAAGPSAVPPVTLSSNASLTWSLVKRVNTQSGTSEIWKATASAPLSNVTVTSTEGSGSWSQSLTVVAFIGAAGVGATGGASAATGAQSVSLTTTQAGSFVYGVGNDFDGAIARTVGPNQTIVHQLAAASNDTFWVQNVNAPVPAAGSQVQLNDTAPTADQWNFAAVEILAASVKTTPTITWAAPANITFGTPLSGTQLNATASVPGTFVYSPAAGTTLPAGAAQSLSVTFTPTDTVNFTTATASVAITVVRATPTISWAAPASITFGTALGATQLNATASVPGAFVYTPASGTVLPVGAAQSLSVTFTPTNTTNYTNATASVAITVVRATPTITWAAPASITSGTALGPTQLNATASVAGTFVYAPPAGTVLSVGVGQTLSVTFTPTNTANYTTATNSVSITVTPAACTFTLSTPSGSASAKKTSGSVNVTASAGTCAWTATSNVAWITITSGASGMGNGVVNYSVAANGKSTVRTGTITIASLPYSVSQIGLVFTDDPIIAGTTVMMAVHVNELRDRIDAIRVARGLLPYAWSNTLTAGATWIQAQDIVDLRVALAQAYVAAVLSPPTYTDPVVTSGMTVKATHIAEIRAAIIVIE